MSATDKIKELTGLGHSIFAAGENEIWYIEKDTGQMKCIYRRKA